MTGNQAIALSFPLIAVAVTWATAFFVVRVLAAPGDEKADVKIMGPAGPLKVDPAYASRRHDVGAPAYPTSAEAHVAASGATPSVSMFEPAELQRGIKRALADFERIAKESSDASERLRAIDKIQSSKGGTAPRRS
jgi:hypothetical protein